MTPKSLSAIKTKPYMGESMEVIVEAVYEKGVLKPKRRLNIPEGSEVTLKILPQRISHRTFGVVRMEKEKIDAIIEEIEDEW